MKILFIGDISGTAGKRAVSNELWKLKKEYNCDFVIANAENTTLGRGLDFADYNLLIESGIDFITMGNHTWHKDDIKEILETKNNIIRPNNIKIGEEYSKYGVGTKLVKVKNKLLRITNLLGISVKMKDDIQTNPFLNLEEIIENDTSDFHFVDFHCETTSEKNAMFLSFWGKVGAIFGTHTHVQTNDARIISNTAYITDAGMTGARDGIIGAKPDSIIAMFKGESTRFRLEEQNGIYQFCCVFLEIDDLTNHPIKVFPITIYES
ncbi:MAG: TIGR00282 family metallophosphoesterase [Malacoplasma sp.]|nr:TIGR00282 family metallophosphoesterase [Malacoplasma sp.]